ncbi:MAG: leucine-rich repeat domain-containing protein [Akkermansiaceae bacterium]|nr:leucine-rich repeat domain-containing protein [Akkermansiaceae bacterium]
MKHLIPLLAFSFLIGCDGEKRNEPTGPNLKYRIKSDTVTITGCGHKASGDLIIPDTIEGNPVTSIGDDAFRFCTSLTSITIGNGVTSIGYAAFQGCTSLTSIKIPDSVTSIGPSTFYGCQSLTSITIPDGVTSIGGADFANCQSLTSITIPDSVISIGINAFYGCTSLTAVTFLGDAPKISNDAFNESSPTIYREPDAKGWGDTLAGRPVKLITAKP